MKGLNPKQKKLYNYLKRNKHYTSCGHAIFSESLNEMAKDLTFVEDDFKNKKFIFRLLEDLDEKEFISLNHPDFYGQMIYKREDVRLIEAIIHEASQ